MDKYLLTYKDAKAIAERYNQKNFWESQYEINGYKQVGKIPSLYQTNINEFLMMKIIS